MEGSAKKILMVWGADYPWDVRIEKTSNSLIKAGHEVHLVCRNLERKPIFERMAELNVHRLRAFPGILNAILSIPFFLNIIWLLKLRQVVKRCNIDMIVVRDLPMSPAGTFIASMFKLPCVLDMAEVYPAMWRVAFDEGRATWGDRLLKNPKVAELIERRFLKKMSHIWVMVEESRQRLLDLGVKEKNISIVGNTPLISEESSSVDVVSPSKGGAVKIIYTGIVSPMRGLDTVTYAVKKLKDDGFRVQFVVAGDGPYLQAIKELVQQLGLSEEVKLLGWVDHKQLPALLADSHIGIVPHKVNGHTNTTLPNKLFDYMGYGLPVIVSNAIPLERIVKECACGMAYQDQCVDSLKEAVVSLLEPGMLAQYGRSGREAYKEIYNWEVDEAVMVGDVARLLR